ncbi:sugar ABC transporter ATP-binding protein [Nocardioides sp. Kera G14]|uniref:sugar ABC transporter ATP-binding protein n=1 Tax=Nocardioides sp. Kera G14 TaxID=2884264 RepID=UPI001D10D0DF|nr:sugar ABC transporter ATP-binding protein [Nocardioides sp. Kera G14]UDY23451.1 sugar ABC transporter ATP-binding protein [Nocardioides sp. Kera G14]
MSELHNRVPAGGASLPPGPRLAVEGINMTFGSARVLRNVSMDVRPGEIHALIGQNGSGKSTLAKILTGLYRPDAGSRVTVDGVDLQLPIRPDEARAAGVAVVHQSLGLVQDSTVLENTRLGRLTGSRFLRRIDWKAEAAATRAVFERLGPRQIPLDLKVKDLREDEKAVVAIARAVQDLTEGGGLIIFDESTRALGRESLERFFGLLDKIVSTGTAALLITHRLEEVVEAADRVTVLRDGEIVVAGKEVEGMTKSELAHLMLGREVEGLEHRTPASADTGAAPVVVDSLKGLEVRDLSLSVRPGEVVGLTGLSGSGHDDVPYLISGVSRAQGGTVTLPDRTVPLKDLSPAKAISSGIALVPEGRESAGLVGDMTVTENISFPQTCSVSSSGKVRPLKSGAEKALAADWIGRLDVRPPWPHAVVQNMSGGNQQKVLLAKWLATDPTLLVLHEPTQAVDVGARKTIVEAVREAAAQGRAVLVAGSDENELALLCDRVLVFNNGVVERELTGDITPKEIVDAIYTGGERTKLRQRQPTA